MPPLIAKGHDDLRLCSIWGRHGSGFKQIFSTGQRERGTHDAVDVRTAAAATLEFLGLQIPCLPAPVRGACVRRVSLQLVRPWHITGGSKPHDNVAIPELLPLFLLVTHCRAQVLVC